MTTLREAAQQALVELEVIAEFLPFIDAKQTTAALRAALEQPEPRREWQSLTDEEREQATGWSVEHIEAALKEKNYG